jgi:hypothetical protein
VGGAGLWPALLALLVTIAVCSPATALADESDAVETEPVAIAAAEEPAGEGLGAPMEPTGAELPPAEAPVAELPVAEEPVAEPPIAEAPVAEPPAAQQPVAEPPAAESVRPPPQEPPLAQDTVPAPAPEVAPEGVAQGSAGSAHNQSTVFQVVWQVQEGCRSYCYGTSQTQDAVQWSETTQSATAVGTDSSSAVNRSVTIQFVWQEQLGCVAFCYETQQTQSASQWAQTTQIATAIAEAVAQALNLAETMQFVWQHQRSCQVECHGASASQSVDQAAATSQSATATGGPGGTPDDRPDSFLGWLVALAESFGATVQTIVQHQQAGCTEWCVGDEQLQQAVQGATTTQAALAGPEPGEPGGDNPSVGEAAPQADPPVAGAEPGEPAAVTPDRPAPLRHGAAPSRDGAPLSRDAVALTRAKPDGTSVPDRLAARAAAPARPELHPLAPARLHANPSPAQSAAGDEAVRGVSPRRPLAEPAADGSDDSRRPSHPPAVDDADAPLAPVLSVAALALLLAAVASLPRVRPQT